MDIENAPERVAKVVRAMKEVDETPDGFVDLDDLADKNDMDHDEGLDAIIATIEKFVRREKRDWQKELVPNINKRVRKYNTDGVERWTFAINKDFIKELVK